MIVVDLGCLDFGYQDSVGALIEEYQPDRLYGFDPHSNLKTEMYWRDGVLVDLRCQAAWLYDGQVNFHENGTSSKIDDSGVPVYCIDFSKWMESHGPAVVKMDIEGAEHQLLERMVTDGTDSLIEELVIEWHDGAERIVDRLSCPIRAWWF